MKPSVRLSRRLLAIADELTAELRELRFAPPVAYVYNPLEYAREPYRQYLERFALTSPELLLLGMNPGPWGMAQTGVPFGTVSIVRDWLGIHCDRLGKPPREHPKRPVEGYACRRDEVSGQRLWGWARDTFGTPERFFARIFVANYCPLLFLAESGSNLTPDKLTASDRAALLPPCDRALQRLVEAQRPRRVVGVGAFAERRARLALAGQDLEIGHILHPSPASPSANLGWAQVATRQLGELGVDLPR